MVALAVRVALVELVPQTRLLAPGNDAVGATAVEVYHATIKRPILTIQTRDLLLFTKGVTDDSRDCRLGSLVQHVAECVYVAVWAKNWSSPGGCLIVFWRTAHGNLGWVAWIGYG